MPRSVLTTAGRISRLAKFGNRVIEKRVVSGILAAIESI